MLFKNNKLNNYEIKFKNFTKSVIFILLIIFSSNNNNTTKISIYKINNDNSNTDTNSIKIDNLELNFFNFRLYYSHIYNLIKISYSFKVFNTNKQIISPSKLTLKYNKHVLCNIYKNKKINIYSLAVIKKDTYYKCIEFYNLNESIKIGVFIYDTPQINNRNGINYTLIIIDKILFKMKYQKDDIFNSSLIDNKYNLILSQLKNNQSLLDTKKLKKLYYSQPINTLKRNINANKNNWNFLNIYNKFFCYCNGFDCLRINNNKCKYYFYLYIIDLNHEIYKKTDYLLYDFILNRYSSDDTFPIFEQMVKRKIKAHYITENKNIYKKFCKKKNYCDSIILVKHREYKINGDFLEKYLTLILKLRQVLSSLGISIFFINNIFYNIDYITYICIGHGVSYFKYYLYQGIYGSHYVHKLLIPNSEKLINMTLKYGWKEENLIKFNLPRWEKYNRYKNKMDEKANIKSKSILVMFTWREIKNGTNISSIYINNIKKLINNDILIKNLQNYNITFYFALHHKLNKYKNVFEINDNIKYIKDKYISEYLTKTNLIVTDYSSIIFDIIYRKIPYIIFIPDAKDPNIINNYNERTYNIIKNFTNNDFDFKNIFFDINSTIRKIYYYNYRIMLFCLQQVLI